MPSRFSSRPKSISELRCLCIVALPINNRKMAQLPVGVAYVVSAIKEIGVEPDLLDLQIYNISDAALTVLLKNNQYDVVCFGFLYNSFPIALRLSRIIKNASPYTKLVIGGIAPTINPTFCLNKTGADIAVMGEADFTIQNLLTTIYKGESLREVSGIVFKENGRLVNTGKPISVNNLDVIPFPSYEKFDMNIYLGACPRIQKYDFSATI